MQSKKALALVDPKDETAKLNARFDELLKKTKHGAKDGDVAELRLFLKDNAKLKLWERVMGVMGLAESYILEQSPLAPGLNEALRERQAAIREELGLEGASLMERLLIQQAALGWLRLGLIELTYSRVQSGNNSLALCEFYDRHLSAAQRRFTRACETLAACGSWRAARRRSDSSLTRPQPLKP